MSSSREKRAAPQEPGRRSSKAAMEATLAAAYELLTESGLGGVSVDEISRR